MSDENNLARFDTREKANAGIWYDVEDPSDPGVPLTNGGKAIRLRLHGQDSNQFIKQRNVNRADEATDARKQVRFSQTVVDQRTNKLIAAATSAWENIPKCWVDGGTDQTPIEYTPENALKLYTNQQWLMLQADGQIADRKNFFGA